MDYFWVRFVVIAGDDELVFDGSDGVEDEVMEEFFAHIVPVIFLWVEVGAIRRQFDQHHIGRNIEYAWTVARRTIIDDEQKILCITRGEFL